MKIKLAYDLDTELCKNMPHINDALKFRHREICPNCGHDYSGEIWNATCKGIKEFPNINLSWMKGYLNDNLTEVNFYEITIKCNCGLTLIAKSRLTS